MDITESVVELAVVDNECVRPRPGLDVTVDMYDGLAEVDAESMSVASERAVLGRDNSGGGSGRKISELSRASSGDSELSSSGNGVRGANGGMWNLSIGGERTCRNTAEKY